MKVANHPIARTIARKPPSGPSQKPPARCSNPSLAQGSLNNLKADSLPSRLQSFEKEFEQIKKSERPYLASVGESFLKSKLMLSFPGELQKFADQSPTKTSKPEMPPRVDKSFFAESVRPQVKQLGDWILTHPPDAKLNPADIYKKSLELNKNNTFEARLTAHNLLKDVTASVRGATSSSPEIKARDHQIQARLMNLREANDSNPDKMGPWYRFFGTGVADAVFQGHRVDSVDRCGDLGEDRITKAAVKMWSAAKP